MLQGGTVPLEVADAGVMFQTVISSQPTKCPSGGKRDVNFHSTRPAVSVPLSRAHTLARLQWVTEQNK